MNIDNLIEQYAVLNKEFQSELTDYDFNRIFNRENFKADVLKFGRWEFISKGNCMI